LLDIELFISVFFYWYFDVPSHCLLASMITDEKSAANLEDPLEHDASLLLLHSQFFLYSLAFGSLVMTCGFFWIYPTLCGDSWICRLRLFITFWEFLDTAFPQIFLTLSFLGLYCAYIGMLDDLPHFPEALSIFLHSFFFLIFTQVISIDIDSSLLIILATQIYWIFVRIFNPTIYIWLLFYNLFLLMDKIYLRK
jgi:hypothetical protein